MFGTLDILRGIGQKLKGNGNNLAEKPCRAVMLQVPKAQPIDIDFKNISFVVKVKKGKKKVLKDVSGVFKSGELTAIMGPSGAGKSSLLNILTGFQSSGASGTINNKECGNMSNNPYQKECCYILQDDRLNPLFTVQEIMRMATDLKLGSNLSSISKDTIINDVLETLGLVSTMETRCGMLSGGQRKRLSIALELVDNPPVMFLDEPTTGLDSSASTQVISVLKRLARDGKTIICTIHQPSAMIYEMFDHVYMLAEGLCIYQGASMNTVGYLKTFGFECPKYHNPADYMLEIANCEYGNFNQRLANESSNASWRIDVRQSPEEETSTYDYSNNNESEPLRDKCTVLISPPTEIFRFWVLVNRCLIQQYRDWTVTHLKLVLHCFTAVTLGLTFFNCGSDGSKTKTNIGFFLIGIVYLTYTSMMPAVLKFPQELGVLKKESFNNWYKLRTYYIATLICTTPIQIFFSTIYCVITYSISSQPMELWRFLMFLGIFMLVTLIAEAVGHMIGTIMNSINGTFCAAIFTCALLAFAGFLVQFPHMSSVMRSISYASYFRYSLEGLLQSVYGYNRSVIDCPKDILYCHLRYPQKILKELGMEGGDFTRSVIILFSALVFFNFLAFFTLRRNLKKS